MHGRQDRLAVKFDGEVDLEEGSAVHTWTGAIQGNHFNGEYATRRGKAGGFAMMRY